MTNLGKKLEALEGNKCSTAEAVQSHETNVCILEFELSNGEFAAREEMWSIDELSNQRGRDAASMVG
jgi:hypothetical protein